MGLKTHIPRIRPAIPGFLARLSNLILIQGMFVVAAVALLIFFSGSDDQVVVNQGLLKSRLQAVTDCVTVVLSDSGKAAAGSFPGPGRRTDSRLRACFALETSIAAADSYVPGAPDNPRSLFQFRSAPDDREDPSEHELSALVDSNLIHIGLRQPYPSPVTSLCCATDVIHYFPFLIDEARPAVLAAITRHDLIISDRGRLEYAFFVLFLCSTLVALLTVYLITRRFKDPLERLINGFEKTAAGELYHIFEEHGDAELRKLVATFNKMSEALWRNQAKLRHTNICLTKANQALLQSQAFLTTLIDRSPNAIVTTDRQGRVVVFNRKASQAFGWRSEDVIGQPLDSLFANCVGRLPTPDRPDGQYSGTEVLCRRRDGSIFPAYVVTSPITADDKEPAAYLYIIRDISESKSFQDMMIRLDRYYTRGEMAGDIAHEINNYLAVLSGNIELMPVLLQKGDAEKVTQKLKVMKDNVDRIVRFTDGLMDTDPDQAQFVSADINQLVENTVAFLKPQNRFDRVDIRTALAPDIGPLEIDVAQLQQVLVNLVQNSAEALGSQPGQKRVDITTSIVHSGGRAFAQVEVRDNGPGVPADKVEHLFNRRFTTKRKGHGLGLITCRKIVESHGGTIEYRAEGETVFAFRIPRERSRTSLNASRPEPHSEQSLQRT
jgi:PAS domain S-box-containing protein